MGHNHSHSDVLTATKGRLIFVILLNLVITAAEVIGGLISGSLALISDALHNFSDSISIVISYIALKLKHRQNSPRHTFGLKRAEILAAVINSAVLIVISFYLFYEAVKRFSEPVVIEPGIMSIVALVGLLANLLAVLLLRKDSKSSMNIRSSYLHLLGDTISSVAVLGGGIAIILWQIHWIDPLLTILIGVYIIRESYSILLEAIHVLMEGAPTNISIEEIQLEVEKFPEVENIHHIHMWMVGENDIHLEAHVNVQDMKISESDRLRKKIIDRLHDRFDIHHITLQFECNQCPESDLIEQHR
ncbi:cation diffusion facilitator family transporter [Melioribacter roseus P3M-2]|uniref:Cation diffusion facilitator family transporter n=1 Tax=Melioribacter roseus (strain DSM 23840 / JCM 17771 / VKM B-2668 / P3M-2) TaxID=1191523 RepID=I6ZQV9_MELRP|nr:cation diffusion facilitator family transporter [Melioribacter roseus]AFN74439.1 cation diffusion facilitator family transporter [Melioribacter roseus P3M-2]